MNIFYLDTNARLAAQIMCDKHVVKMILESAQLMCTAHHELGSMGPIQIPYKATHKNHPSAKWVRETDLHYIWLFDHFLALCDEYTYRYGKVHKTEQYKYQLYLMPCINKHNMFTPPPQCMPDEYKVPGDTVQAYRNYYRHGKAHLLKYTKREAPEWLSTTKA